MDEQVKCKEIKDEEDAPLIIHQQRQVERKNDKDCLDERKLQQHNQAPYEKLVKILLFCFLALALSYAFCCLELNSKVEPQELIQNVPLQGEIKIPIQNETKNIAQNDMKSPLFIATNEFQQVGNDQILPRGLEIKIDLKTGETWARLVQTSSESGLIFKEDVPQAIEERKAPGPGDFNIPKKWERRYALVSYSIEKALKSLSTNSQNDQEMKESLDLLLIEAEAFEVGAGILHSKNLANLLSLLDSKDYRDIALEILAAALQNNVVSIGRAVELKLLSTFLIPVLKNDNLTMKSFHKSVQCINSILGMIDESKGLDSELVKGFIAEGGHLHILEQQRNFASNINDRCYDMISTILIYCMQVDNSIISAFKSSNEKLIRVTCEKPSGQHFSFCPKSNQVEQ